MLLFCVCVCGGMTKVKNMSRDQAHIFGDTKENCHPFYEGGNGAVFIPNCIENLKFSKQE